MRRVARLLSKPPSSSRDRFEGNEFGLINAIKASDLAKFLLLYVEGKFVYRLKDGLGNNILHMAVLTGNASLVQGVLLFYETDSNELTTQRNNHGQLAEDLAEGSIKLLFRQWKGELDVNLELVCGMRYEFNGNAMRNTLNNTILLQKIPHLNKRSRVLVSLDGGGIRGLASVQILKKLEQGLSKPLIKYADWMSGTSTGSYIALLMAQNKSLVDIQKSYLRLKNIIFKGMRPYNTEILEKSLKEILSTKPLSAIRRPKIIIPTCVMHSALPRMKLFRNYTIKPFENEILDENDYSDPDKVEMWIAGRCSSAAPTYFTPYHGFIDGGIASNNPAMELMTEFFEYNYSKQLSSNFDKIKKGREEVNVDTFNDHIHSGNELLHSHAATLIDRIWPASELLKDTNLDDVGMSRHVPENIACVISIGTGQWLNCGKLNEDSSALNSSTVSNVSPGRGNFIKKIGELKSFLSIFIRQLTASEGLPVERARSWCHSIGVPYFRFTPKLTIRVKLDDASDVSIIQMIWDTEIYLRTECMNEIKKITNFLQLMNG
uniref:PNPLA domain-containing protein n=1 Tax=Rhabditophanes sp. KR3021 TaxID=114890 RepID=A0AC35TW51_9BILA